MITFTFSHEIKRHLLLGREVMMNPDSVLKSRDITLPTKVCLVKAMVFPVVMYGRESWTIKKAEHWRIDAGIVVLEKTLESPLDSKEIRPVNPKRNQPWLFLGRTDPEALILWTPDTKSWLIGKDCDAGKDWGQEEKGNDRGWDSWMASVTQRTWVWANSRRWWRMGKPGMLQSIGSQRVRCNLVTEQQVLCDMNCR